MNTGKRDDDLIFEQVWQKDVTGFRQEVMRIWQGHGGPQGEEAEKRLKQLVFLVRNGAGDVVGMSTAFKAYVKRLRNQFFVFRMMIIPAYRIPGLTSRLLVLTRDFLESVSAADAVDPAIGLITLVQNEQISKFRNEAIWPASKMVYIGNSASGHPIRVYYFKGARIIPER